MELTREDTQKAKGVAILGMVMLHLFCRLGDLPYTPLIWIGDIPLIYYLGLFGDICVPIYCFCSGYAHYLLKEKHETQYTKTIFQKLFRFLKHYWTVVVLFSLAGLLMRRGNGIPGSLAQFLGNVFLYRINYNGAWWFVVTYVFLCALSPLLSRVVQRMRPLVVLSASGFVYLIAYLFRFKFILTFSNEWLNWGWQQLILLGTSQFGYLIGMVCRKECWISQLRNITGFAAAKPNDRQIAWRVLVLLTPTAAFVGHCMVQSLGVAPFTAGAVLLSIFLSPLPVLVNRIFLFLGKHSTNIWLIHMFFYNGALGWSVFSAQYPVFVLLLLLLICIAVSVLINALEKLWRNLRGKVSIYDQCHRSGL